MGLTTVGPTFFTQTFDTIMAQNYIQSGASIEVALGSGETTVKVGDGRLIGTMFGVVLSLTRAGQTVFSNQASAQGDIAIVALNGVFSLPKASGAITLGAKLYWDATAKNLTTTTTSNTFVGYAFAAAASGDTTVPLKLQTA